MLMRFLLLLGIWIVSGVQAQSDSNSPWLLSPQEYQETIIRKPLLAKRLSEWKDQGAIVQLGVAALAYDSAQYEKALGIYRAHKKDLPTLEGQILRRMALCHIQLGKHDSARALLLSEVSLVKNRAWWESIDRILVEILVADTSLATSARIDSLSMRLKGKPTENYRNWLLAQKAMLHFQQGEKKQALQIWEILLAHKGYRETAVELLAQSPLPALNTDVLHSIVVAHCKVERLNPCLEGIDSLLQRGVSKERHINLLALRAQAFKAKKQEAEAIAVYRYLLDSIEVRPSWMQALIRLERGLNHKEEAARLDSLFREKYPYSPENANNMWVKALEFEQEGQLDSAALYYGKLSDPRFGGNPKHQWAPFRRGYLEMQRGDLQTALLMWDSLNPKEPSAMAESAKLFFQAETYWKAGDSAKAKEKFIETHLYFPLSWYGHRARQRLDQLHLLPKAQLPKIEVFASTDSAALDWIRLKQPRNKRTELDIAERLKQVELMYLIGFPDEAKSLLVKSNNAFARRGDYLFLLGQMHRRLGNYGESYRMARLFLEIVDKRWFVSMPRTVAEFLYPLPELWRTDVEKFITPPVDIYFLFGVMRQESIFIPTITSPVGARGLMQFMPQTGLTVSRLEGIAGYRDDLLYNPVMSMRLGNRYLGDLINEYGSPVYALANYNAGPTPTKRWVEAHKKMNFDEQVEAISYWETRDYIKKVMGNYWSYKAIYE